MRNSHSPDLQRVINTFYYALSTVHQCFSNCLSILFSMRSTHPDSSDWLLRSNITQYRWGYCKYFEVESCGARFLAPRTGIAPLSFAPTRTGPKNSKFYGPDLEPTRLYFPRTGPDRNSLASTRNLKVSTRTDPKFWGTENILCWDQRDQIKFQTTINTWICTSIKL